jgi:hypothetical protein
VSGPENEGVRLGRMIAAEPELTSVATDSAGRKLIARFTAYLTADGADIPSVLARMERLKFEAIVRGKTLGEVLAETEGPCASG